MPKKWWAAAGEAERDCLLGPPLIASHKRMVLLKANRIIDDLLILQCWSGMKTTPDKTR